jgi:hypothetical protein
MQQIFDNMNDEMEDMEKYADEALVSASMGCKENAQKYYQLANEEGNHYMVLHAMAEDAIAKYRKDHGEPPAAMLEIYNWQHEKAEDEMDGIKDKLAEVKKKI